MKNLKKLLLIYTQKELASLLGYKSQATIANWLKTKKVPARISVRLEKEVRRCH